jgi:hypothetical protein
MRGCMGTSDPAAACVTFRSANPARVYFLVRALSNLPATHFFCTRAYVLRMFQVFVRARYGRKVREELR